MADDRPLVEQVLDVAVYAPIGALALAAEHVPDIVGKGRATVEGRITVARMIGRMAVATARRRLDETIASYSPTTDRRPPTEQEQTAERASTAPAAQASSALEERDPLASEERAQPDGPGDAPTRSSRRVRSHPDGQPPAVESLAIPGYDSLAASQVVPRLAGLTREELETVRRYEQATRRRRTILGRVAQLQDDADARG
jgi:hypothetical protein